MRIVEFKGKGNRGLYVNGKKIQFNDGVAKVSNEDAETIKRMDNPEYNVIDPEPEIIESVEPKPKRNKKRKTAKSKED